MTENKAPYDISDTPDFRTSFPHNVQDFKIKVDTWKPGLDIGQVIHIKNVARGLDGDFLIEKLVSEALGNGNFVYHVTLRHGTLRQKASHERMRGMYGLSNRTARQAAIASRSTGF